MGWFSRQQEPEKTPVKDPICPLSQQRIKDLLNKDGYVYDVDDEGDLGGRWDHSFIYFFIMGKKQEILNISGRFLIPIPEEQIDEARLFIEDWHRDHMWPKAYIFTDNHGRYRVSAEVALDHEHGVSDAQLHQHIKCAIGTIHQCFDGLRESLDLQWEETH